LSSFPLLLLLGSKYTSQHPVLHVLPSYERSNFTSIQNKIILLHILRFMFKGSRWRDKISGTERQQAFPEFNLLLISSWIQFWFISDIPKIWNLFSTMSDRSLYIYIYIYIYYIDHLKIYVYKL
jgi:hypothetical protein